MLNFKKKGIFTRQASKEDAPPEQEPQEGQASLSISSGPLETTPA